MHLGWLTAAIQWPDLLSAVDAPIVVSCHGSDLRIDPLLGDRYREPLRAVFDRADLVHCVSDELARHAIALGLEPSKVFVHPWGVDTTFFRPAPEREARVRTSSRGAQTLRVVSVGRLHWVKGYEFALQALAQVRRAGVEIEYTIIGNADDKELLVVLATVRDLGLESQVHLRGRLSRNEVVEALQAADVFLLASLCEGLSTATLEAMAVGLPVVVTDVGGMREAVTDGIEGRVVPPRDPAAIAAALARSSQPTHNSAPRWANADGDERPKTSTPSWALEQCSRSISDSFANVRAHVNGPRGHDARLLDALPRAGSRPARRVGRALGFASATSSPIAPSTCARPPPTATRSRCGVASDPTATTCGRSSSSRSHRRSTSSPPISFSTTT